MGSSGRFPTRRGILPLRTFRFGEAVPERLSVLAIAPEVFLTGAAFLSRSGNGIDELGDIGKGTVTAVDGTTTFNGLQTELAQRGLDRSITLRPVATHQDGVRLVKEGTSLAHAGDQAILLPHLGTNPGLRLGEKLNSFEPYAIATRRCDTQGRDLIDAGLAQLFRSGEIWTIYNRHFAGIKPGPLLISTFISGGLPR